MTDRIRWAILGNAEIARKCMLPAISRSRNGRVHLLATRRPDAAIALAQKYKISGIVSDYNAALNHPEVDAVYIPLPNYLHYEWTLKALAAGKHVLCEKPLACNADQAVQMAHAARNAGRALMEGLMYRFHPRSEQIKSHVTRGDIGQVRLVRAAFAFHIETDSPNTGSNNTRLTAPEGAGALWDVGIYGIDTACWLLDRGPEKVQGFAVRDVNGVDLLFAGLLNFKEGALAVVEAGFITALEQTFSVTGSRAAIELPHNAYIPWEVDAEYTLRGVNQEKGQLFRIEGTDQYRIMAEHFADVVMGRGAQQVTLEESIRNLRVMDALNRSSREGRTLQPE